jgi:hypothetical protein
LVGDTISTTSDGLPTDAVRADGGSVLVQHDEEVGLDHPVVGDKNVERGMMTRPRTLHVI